MATKTTTLNIRIDPDVKEQAEAVFRQLGISSSIAVNMFFKQVIMQQGLPFDLKVRYPQSPKPTGMVGDKHEASPAGKVLALRENRVETGLTQSDREVQQKAVEAQAEVKPSTARHVVSTVRSFEDASVRMAAWEKSHDYEGI